MRVTINQLRITGILFSLLSIMSCNDAGTEVTGYSSSSSDLLVDSALFQGDTTNEIAYSVNFIQGECYTIGCSKFDGIIHQGAGKTTTSDYYFLNEKSHYKIIDIDSLTYDIEINDEVYPLNNTALINGINELKSIEDTDKKHFIELFENPGIGSDSAVTLKITQENSSAYSTYFVKNYCDPLGYFKRTGNLFEGVVLINDYLKAPTDTTTKDSSWMVIDKFTDPIDTSYYSSYQELKDSIGLDYEEAIISTPIISIDHIYEINGANQFKINRQKYTDYRNIYLTSSWTYYFNEYEGFVGATDDWAMSNILVKKTNPEVKLDID